MGLPGLDGAFGGVTEVTVGWHALEGDVVLEECLFEVGGAFVVDDVELGDGAVVAEKLVAGGPGGGDVLGLSAGKGACEDGVGVEIVQDEDVLVATGGANGELAGLVGV